MKLTKNIRVSDFHYRLFHNRKKELEQIEGKKITWDQFLDYLFLNFKVR